MGELISDSLFLPAMVLALLAWLVPKLLSMVLPEGVGPLMVLTFLSSVILFAISGAFFFVLYLWQGVPFAELTAPGWAANIWFFGRLGLSSAIIWGPLMILSVAGLPRNWTEKVW